MINKFKLSLNTGLIDKIAPTEAKFYAQAFDPVDLTLDELERSINEGIASSYQFEGNYRRTEYFLASGILVVEIDGGLTIEECLQIQIVETFGSLLYTTPSHSPDHHRFRLIFGLPRTIIDPNELRYASRALAQRLGGDMRQTNPAALFLGSRGCHFEQIGSSISDELLDELIQDGRTELANDSISNNRPTAHRSYRRLPATQSVTLANGTKSTLRDLVGNEPVYCPFHLDQKPSAFVASSKGNRFLHCSHCKKTWWMSGKDQLPDEI